MDKKAALEILNLDETDSLADAKKAYRSLAKQYHPDVLGKNSSAKTDSEARMKDINLAYRYLVPLLKQNRLVKKSLKPIPDDEFIKRQPLKKEKTGWDTFFIKCGAFLNNLFFIKEKPVVVKNQKQNPEQPPIHRKEKFGHVLEKIYEKPAHYEKRKPGVPKKKKSWETGSFGDYRKYMQLKQKLKSGRSRNPGMPFSRVTKIDPVDRIDAVKKD